MDVREVVRLDDGREIKVVLTDEEHRIVLSAGIQFLIKTGALVLGEVKDGEFVDGGEKIGGQGEGETAQ